MTMFFRAVLLPVATAIVVLLSAETPTTQTSPTAGAIPPALAAFLTSQMHFSKSDFAALGRGESVAKSLTPGDSREVAVAGALRFDIPVSFYLERLRDITKFKAGHDVFQVGVFRNPATAADLDPLVLDPRDIEDLRRCVVGHCKVRLDAAAMARFKKDVNWNDPQASVRAHAVAREVLAGYVAAYQRSGNAALVEYRDGNPPVKLADQTKLLLTRSPFLAAVNPGLARYVERYPAEPSPYAEDILYWSKETFGMKPIVTATHLTIWQGPNDTADAFVTSKQLYSTHYFDASLAITLAVSVGSPQKPQTVIVYINRSLVDALDGGILGPLKRPIARSKARGGLDEHLVALKKRLEKEYAARK